MNKKFLKDLTVFIISSGEETKDDCIQALENQNCLFKIKNIHDISPMSAAFQAMPDRCDTKYFIQVDADMILNVDAVLTLYNAIKESSFLVYRVAGQLYEEGFGIGGAVKCWKKSVFRFIKFHDCRTVDRDLHNRLKWFGIHIKHINNVMGVHRPRHSNFSLYLKAKSDVEKWRFLKRSPMLYAIPLLRKILDKPQVSCYQLFGVLVGALTSIDRVKKSKDNPLERDRFYKLIDLFFTREEQILNCKIDITKHNSIVSVFESAYRNFLKDDYVDRHSLVSTLLDIYSPHFKNNTTIDLQDKIIKCIDR